jgi:WD40 repeat protein
VSRFQYTAFVSYSHAADGRLAQILQSGLQTFAKPWYRRRTIRVFRDTTGLGLTPDLWESIRVALSSSEYFILLASEQAARSPWVDKEVDAWLDMGFANRLLIVWTDGTLAWDPAAADFDWARTTCMPPRLRGALPAEPLHLDLRWARSSTDLSPRRPEFLDAIARLSSTLRGQPLDDLIGEDIRQHRRNRRLAGVVIATLSALLIGAITFGGLAFQQRNIALQQTRVAEEQRAAAERQRAEAERQREEADRQRDAAQTQRREAERQQRVAEEQREASRQRLVQAMVANGLRRIDERDLSGSALWFAEALRLETARPGGQALQRLRLRSTLGQHPGLQQVWAIQPRALRRWITFGRDGRYAVTYALLNPDTATTMPSGGLQIWDPQTAASVPLTLPSGHRLLAVDATAEGIRAITAGADQAVRVWDGRAGRELARLPHPEDVTAAELGADGATLATAGRDRVARLWDLRTGQLLGSFTHEAGLVAAAPTRDQQRVLTLTQDGTAHVWPVTPGAGRHVMLTHQDGVQLVDVTSDGRRALTLDGARTARLWNVTGDSPALLHSWPGVNHVELSPDGTRLVMASEFGEASVWSVRDEPREVSTVKHAGFVLHASFSRDGRRFASASTDRTARVWSAASGAPLTPPLYHEDTVSHLSLAPDDARLATVTADGTVRVWTLGTPARRYAHKSVTRATFHPDGRRLLAMGDFLVQVWDLVTGTPLALRTTGQVSHAAFSPDARRVVTTELDGVAKVWDTGSGAEVLSLSHGRRLRHASFSPDGRWLATAGQTTDGRHDVAFWDLASGARLFSLPHGNQVTSTEFTADGRRLLTVDFGGVARVWDLEQRREIPSLHQRERTRGVFSPDGTRLAVLAGRASATVQDAASGRAIVSGLRNDQYGLTQLAFAPDGRSLLLLSEGSARIHDARTGTPLTPLLTHAATGQMLHAGFSRDGRRIVTVDTDAGARVWDTDSGQALTPFLSHPGGARHGVFSPDGSRLATAGSDAVLLWELDGPASPEADARMALQAQVLAARRVDPTGAIVPLPAAELRAAWAKLRR